MQSGCTAADKNESFLAKNEYSTLIVIRIFESLTTWIKFLDRIKILQ